MKKDTPARMVIMGGSFDPIHLGHLIVAERAAGLLRADRVLFVPCNIPPHKPPAGLTPGRHRLKMIELAIRGNPWFRACDLELKRGGVSYTVETLDALRELHGPRAKLLFLIGADSLKELPTWREYRRILSLCTVVTAGRPGFDVGNWRGDGAFTREEATCLKTHILDTPLIGISSTEIRQRRGEGLSIRYLVPAAVERYIVSRGLYRGAGPRGPVKCRAAR